MAYTNFQDLLAGISKEIEDTLSKEVGDHLRGRVSQDARNKVILDTPGRGTGGVDDMQQIVAEVDKSVNGRILRLKVKDVAKPSPSVFNQPFDYAKDASAGGTTFAKWIEYGQWVDLRGLLLHRQSWDWSPAYGAWMDIYDPYSAMVDPKGVPTRKVMNYKPRREPRPFITPIQEDIIANPQPILDLLEKNIGKK